MSLADLAQSWRDEAKIVRSRYARDDLARVCEVHAEELEEAIESAAAEQLTLERAASESGYSKRRIRELVASGAVPNAGRKGAPRIRRADLPRRGRADHDRDRFNADEHVAAILGAAS